MKLFSRTLETDTDVQQRELREERNRRIMASGWEELSRSDLDFEALGGRVIEHLPTGRFFRLFFGDPTYVGTDVSAFFVTAEGDATLLQRASLASRDELAEKRAKRDARRAARETAAKEQRAEIRELSRR